MPQLSIPQLRKKLTAENFVGATLHGQITDLAAKVTKTQKPYWELTFADGADSLRINVWNDHPAYASFGEASVRAFLAITGFFKLTAYGIEPESWTCAPLAAEEVAAVLNGGPERADQMASLMREVEVMVGEMRDPVLRLLCGEYLARHGEPLQRAAGARGNHHARRGGLLEHTCGMMLLALHICQAREELNRDLLLAGALFHDCGKLVENQYEKDGFGMPFSARAELYGHIAIGVALVQRIYRESYERLPAGESPARAEHIVDCLCHLVLSHHGELAWGSPVEPKLPEAAVLHYIDQIDAKLEMMRVAYETQREIGPGVIERKYPMKVNLVRG